MHAGHRERVRKKFVTENCSLDSFHDHNILELLLFYAIPRADTNEIAHGLMNRFGSLSAVFDAPLEELIKVDGIGERSAVLIKLIPQTSKSYLEDKVVEREVLDTSDKMIEYLRPKFIGQTNEIFLLLCLDNSGRVKNCYQISEGTMSVTEISKRKIVEKVVACNATSVAVAHNHPNGVSAPSRDDVNATIVISELLNSIDVQVLDHFIFSQEHGFSMASNERFAGLF